MHIILIIVENAINRMKFIYMRNSFIKSEKQRVSSEVTEAHFKESIHLMRLCVCECESSVCVPLLLIKHLCNLIFKNSLLEALELSNCNTNIESMEVILLTIWINIKCNRWYQHVENDPLFRHRCIYDVIWWAFDLYKGGCRMWIYVCFIVRSVNIALLIAFVFIW